MTIKKPPENAPYIEDQHIRGFIKRDISDRDSTPKSSNYRNTPRDSPRLSQYHNDNRTRHKSIHFGFRFRYKDSIVQLCLMTIDNLLWIHLL